VTLQVVTSSNVPMAAFWDILPCSVIEVERRFRDAYCVQHEGVDGGSRVLISETSVYLCDTTRRYIQYGCHLQGKLQFCCEISGSHGFEHGRVFGMLRHVV
jgi:hypothetical protein